jgi:hypothetical protein
VHLRGCGKKGPLFGGPSPGRECCENARGFFAFHHHSGVSAHTWPVRRECRSCERGSIAQWRRASYEGQSSPSRGARYGLCRSCLQRVRRCRAATACSSHPLFVTHDDSGRTPPTMEGAVEISQLKHRSVDDGYGFDLNKPFRHRKSAHPNESLAGGGPLVKWAPRAFPTMARCSGL